ncbi:hypothetical protein ACEPAI_2298 [Sanghuangporus weigelae]
MDLLSHLTSLEENDLQNIFAELPELAESSWSRFEESGNREDLDQAIAFRQTALDSCPNNNSYLSETMFGLALFLYSRFERWGATEDLERSINLDRDALALRPEGHPDRDLSLNNLAMSLKTRFDQSGTMRDLEDAIALKRSALDLRPDGHPLRASALGNLATSLSTRFDQNGSMQDLDDAIALERSALELLPEGHPLRARALGNLATFLTKRFDQIGRLQDLDHAIALQRSALALLPEVHSDRALSLGNLATFLSKRFDQNGSMQDLEDAIALQRSALEFLPEGHPARSMSLCNLASSLSTRFDQNGRVQDLEDAIALYRSALEFLPEGHPGRSMSLCNLATFLSTRFDQNGRMQDLEDAIALHRSALELRPEGHPNRASSLDNLALSLKKRFNQIGVMRDLEDAIALHRSALELRPEGHPDRASSLNNLALSLATRFDQIGVMRDLDDAITFERSALELRPESHPLRASALGNLATSLSTRFDQIGRLQDLDHAIALQRSALALLPEVHSDRASALGNLATSLSTRFDQNGSMQDLDDAIALERSALDLRPEGHPDRASSLGNLALLLKTRFDQIGAMRDLEDAIALQRSALELRPEGHPDRSMSLGNLATSLSTRFDQIGAMQDLEDAIALQRSALELRPEGHPDRSMSLRNLAKYLYLRFGRESNVNDFNESIQLLGHATAHSFSSFSHRLMAVRIWTTIARSQDHPTLLEAYKSSISLLQRALFIRPTLSTQHQFISSDSRYQAFALDAASCAIEKGNFSLAIEFLEQGRALLWSQMRGLRTPLERLSQASKSLADRFEDCSRRLEALLASSESRQVGSDVDGDGMQANSARQASVDAMLVLIRKLTEEQEAIIGEIREVTGFEDFLRAAPFEILKEAASEGPVIVLNHSKFRCDALIIMSDQETPCVCVPLDDKFYSDSTDIYKELIQRRKGKNGTRSKKYDEILRRVMKMLWDRVVSKIVQKLKELGVNEGSRIWWCPTSVLSALPFHAAGPYEDANGRMKYLLDDYISSYAPTLISLIRARSGVQNGSERMLFVADTKLPAAKAEKDLIRRSRRPIDKQLLDDDATPEALLRLLPGAQWVHFSCHGQLDEEPFKSSLKLPGGKLTLLDIARANLPNAQFAFLSACHTAEQGRKYALDEGLHLAAAIQFCGFRSVVGTMWEVLDIDCPLLVGIVYGYMMMDLEEGEMRFKRAAAGVRRAALRLREQGDGEPYANRVDIMAERWVNFVHIGA